MGSNDNCSWSSTENEVLYLVSKYYARNLLRITEEKPEIS
jgi:hypothetical protein